MSIKPIFDTSYISSFSSLKDKIDDYVKHLDGKTFTYMAKDGSRGGDCTVDFTYNKKFGKIQAYKHASDSYEKVVFKMNTKNITLYNYLFKSESLGLTTPFFAIAYFGSVVVPVADWIQGQLRSDQIGQIRAHYSSGSQSNTSNGPDISELFKIFHNNVLTSFFGPNVRFDGSFGSNFEIRIDI